MVQETSIQIRLTKNDKEKIISEMKNAEYTSISEFVRSRVLEHKDSSRYMIKEIHKKIVLDIGGKYGN